MKQKNKLTVILLLTLMLTSCSRIIAATTESAIPTAVETESIQDLDYYNGITVITQYYTFLGHGHYEDAYQFLGPSARSHSPSLEDFIKAAKTSFKTVEIVTIQPLNEWKKQQGVENVTPDPLNTKKFYVQIKAWGEGGMSGSVVNGTLQTLLLTLVRKEGTWKIDSFATGPKH